MNKPNIFFRLTKVDEMKRTVEGIATAEIPDKSGEICDYVSTKPLYQKWSDGIKKASQGKSLGNVRAMHGNVAAGKIVGMDFDDVNKSISIVANIVDDAEWKKVVEGVYTGFSHGGEYVRKWADGENTRYTADPSEISIVDNPCLAEASFQMVKADGTVEMKKIVGATVEPELRQGWLAKDGSFHAKKNEAERKNIEVDAERIAQATIAATKAAIDNATGELSKREFSEEKRKELADKGHAMPDGSFPIETAGDVENAVHDFGRTGSKPDVKTHITTRAKAIGATDSLPADWKGSTKQEDDDEAEKIKRAVVTKLAKGTEVWDAATAIQALEAIHWLMSSEMTDADDDNEEGAQQVADLQMVCERLKSFISSEIMEGTRADGTLAMAARGGMTKAEHEEHIATIHKAAAGIMHRCMKCMGKDMEMFVKTAGEEMAEHIKAIHKKAGNICNSCMKMGSKFKPEDDEDDADDGEGDAVSKMALVKSMAENKAMTKAMSELNDMVGTLLKRIDTLERQPAARKGVLFAVDRSHEAQPDLPAETVNKVNLNSLRLSPAEQRGIRGF